MDIRLNVLKQPSSEGFNVPVGTGSTLANPFDTGDLFEDIISYEEWLYDGTADGSLAIIPELDAIGTHLIAGETVNLVCPCQPTGWYRTCHGVILRRLLQEAIAALPSR